MNAEHQEPIVTEVIQEIFHDKSLYTPVYRADLITEDDVRREIASLPLIYIWNENRESGAFTISVNGVKIEEVLEGFIERSDERFSRYRNQISDFVNAVVNESVLETCQRQRQFPSQIFSSE